MRGWGDKHSCYAVSAWMTNTLMMDVHKIRHQGRAVKVCVWYFQGWGWSSRITWVLLVWCGEGKLWLLQDAAQWVFITSSSSALSLWFPQSKRTSLISFCWKPISLNWANRCKNSAAWRKKEERGVMLSWMDVSWGCSRSSTVGQGCSQIWLGCITMTADQGHTYLW